MKSLRAMTELYPELRKRGLRVLPGGDYGFPNNPIGRNARDLDLFVRLFGYSPAEALRATTQYGGRDPGGTEVPLSSMPSAGRTSMRQSPPGIRRERSELCPSIPP